MFHSRIGNGTTSDVTQIYKETYEYIMYFTILQMRLKMKISYSCLNYVSIKKYCLIAIYLPYIDNLCGIVRFRRRNNIFKKVRRILTKIIFPGAKRKFRDKSVKNSYRDIRLIIICQR